ncbi:MAG TPA: metallopeptidase TldD-related protein [Soehngenia sp.]|mgnify:CR=1 FL=1|nr:metallopeptidase TldD-related protein [Soehngenia sp.]
MIKEKYITNVKEISLNVSQSRIDSVRNKNITKTGLRVYDNGYIGYAGAIGNYDESDLLNKALSTLDNKISYDFGIEANKKIHEDYSTEIIDENKMLDEFETILSVLREEQPDFYFSHKFNLTDYSVNLINENGLDLYHKDRFISLGLLFKEKKSLNIMDGFVGFEGRKYDRALALKDIFHVLNAYKNKVDLPNKNTLPVVFDTSEELPFLKFFQDLDGNNFGSGSSLLSGKMGIKVFNDNFTLYQNNNPNDIPVPFFDAEGVVNKNYRYSLIENGIVASPYTNKKISKKYNLPLTGSATCEYDGVPTLGVPALKVKESEKTAKELLGGEMGIFVLMTSGGDFTPEGNFAAPVQLGLLFDGQKFIGRLPELNISSNVFDMFGNSFRGVSKDNCSLLSTSKYMIMDMKVSKL